MPANFGDDLLSSKSNISFGGAFFFVIIVKPLIFKCVGIAFCDEKNPLLGNYSVTNDFLGEFFGDWQLNMRRIFFLSFFNVQQKYVKKYSLLEQRLCLAIEVRTVVEQ